MHHPDAEAGGHPPFPKKKPNDAVRYIYKVDGLVPSGVSSTHFSQVNKMKGKKHAECTNNFITHEKYKILTSYC